MDIKLNATLSAYSKIDAINPESCDHEAVSFEDIDTLFESSNNNYTVNDTSRSNEVSFADIDSLFK